MKRNSLYIIISTVVLAIPVAVLPAAELLQHTSPLAFINTAFENASPLDWEFDKDGNVIIDLIYDHERSSPNRANGHWFFQLHAASGSDLTLILQNFDNVWNGRIGIPISDRTSCFLSVDGKKWEAIPAEKIEGNRLKIPIHMEGETLFVARMEPYRLSDLERLMDEIKDNPLVEITPIGKTVEGRQLEIIRVGKADAPYRVVIRARAHAWEAGGNWVAQGLINSLLEKSEENQRYLEKFCLYIMPMANKDFVVHGRTRFNALGKDLNRNWDQPADPVLSPENHAFEQWLTGMIEKGKRPHLAIDLHNDNGGNIHISRPAIDLERYLANMQRFEELLTELTWFTEGSTKAGFRNPGSFGEGLLERFGIDAFVYELNCDWIEGLKKAPFGEDWELLGRQLREVLYRYFENYNS
ncbi:MAG: peptidase M14 [Candidatus Omnitrophota bacterium]|jgi:hypothetical protein|nr:MAG: peptidase M14 [Candidatus Omnitrophota bacterium]